MQSIDYFLDIPVVPVDPMVEVDDNIHKALIIQALFSGQ